MIRDSPEGATVNSQGREPLETMIPKRNEPRRGDSTAASPGLNILMAIQPAA